MKTLILMVTLAAASVSAQPVPVDPSRYLLFGSLGQSYLIRMELERSGNSLTGRYSYERPGVLRSGNNSIRLAGSVDADGVLRLIEMAEVVGREEPVPTGEFNGRVTTLTVDGQPMLHLAGTWTRARDGRKLPFSLDQSRPLFGSLSLASQVHTESDQKLNSTLRLTLPRLGDGGSAFNRHLTAIVEPLTAEFRRDVAELRREERERRDEVPPSSFEIDYDIVHHRPELVSLQLRIFVYTGGAHPNSLTRSVNWDLRLDREITLTDLFRPDSGFGGTISRYCRRELARLNLGDPAWLDRGTAFNYENYQRWNPTRAGLRITFDPYQVAAYAQGAFEVTIPWTLLATLLRPSFGPLASSRPR